MSKQGRTAIVTGSASGLGRALAVRLARDGWRLALADIAKEANRETLAMVERAGGSGQCEPLDVSRLDDWLALRDRLQSQWPQLDLLVNNAGIAGSGEVGGFPIDEWRRLLDVNLMGAVYGCHVFIGWLKNHPHRSHIINTASLAAFAAAPTMAAYNVAKAGIVALSETLYAEAKKHGVGVTVLCPGFFSTNLLLQGHFANEDEKQLAQRMMQNSSFDAAHVAELAVRAMTRRRLYVVTGAKARWFWRIKRWFPRTYMNLLARRYVKGLPESF
ncbi:MAG TPA: SDR family NAD(P)-dependent oxidoreductase [Pirellulales bacterium]|nr:SDR family NAD(P)-dependent oxidoreductase [Pirellulales bacterium]